MRTVTRWGVSVTIFAVTALLCAQSALGQAGYGDSNPANDAKQLKSAEKSYLSAKKAFKGAPTAAHKKSFVVAADRFALLSMTSAALDRKVKYKQALQLYREVLKCDPSNYEAKSNSDLIISIYKSMHRPIPN